jgi:hypothetical protein
MRLLTKTRRRKHAEKQGFWRNWDLVQPPMILQDQTNKRSTPKHKNEKHRPCPARQRRNTFHTCDDSIGIAVAICYIEHGKSQPLVSKHHQSLLWDHASPIDQARTTLHLHLLKGAALALQIVHKRNLMRTCCRWAGNARPQL